MPKLRFPKSLLISTFTLVPATAVIAISCTGIDPAKTAEELKKQFEDQFLKLKDIDFKNNITAQELKVVIDVLNSLEQSKRREKFFSILDKETRDTLTRIFDVTSAQLTSVNIVEVITPATKSVTLKINVAILGINTAATVAAINLKTSVDTETSKTKKEFDDVVKTVSELDFTSLKLTAQ